MAQGAAPGKAQRVEYIWLDGQEGSDGKGLLFNECHSKTKVIPANKKAKSVNDLPTWSYDGSSTDQASGNDSDLLIKPVRTFHDPLRGGDDLLAVCEVLNPDGTPHKDNNRRPLENMIDKQVEEEEPWYGLEQEYTMLNSTGWPYNWPAGGYPEPQGNNYCGVGNNSVYGRKLAEAHMKACIDAGITIAGINAEVMPAQWEFQIGPVGPLELGDNLTCARWLLHRLGEEYGITVTFEAKPIRGDWNGAGAHTNFSTKSMRNKGGIEAINSAVDRLSKAHAEHIAEYGTGNEKRLTGHHETASIDVFSSGTADRGSSVRIPRHVHNDGCGYLEDRRPSANCDPYKVAKMLLKTTLGKQ